MSGPVHRSSRDADWMLALFAAAVAATAFGLLLRPPPSSTDERERPRIAVLASAAEDVRRRPSGSLVWEHLSAGAALSEGDAVFVPPRSAASVVFENGTRLELDENTLVALEPRREQNAVLQVRVGRGKVVGRSTEAGLALSTGHGVALLEGRSQARLSASDRAGEVDVFAGAARLADGTRLAERESAVATAGGWKHQGRRPVELVGPPALQRIYFSTPQPPKVVLGWRGELPRGARLELTTASTSGGALIPLQPGMGSAPFSASAEGRFEWRLLDGEGNPLSHTGQFVLVRDVPPVLMSPVQGEPVAGFRDEKVPFEWTRVAGVRTYRLEVARGSDFHDVVFSTSVEGTGLRLSWPAGEGRFFWRVRSFATERGTSPWSRTGSFRFLERPLPDAPELQAPELELDP